MTELTADTDWKGQRKSGMVAIAVSTAVAAGLWFAVRYLAPIPAGMDDLGERTIFTLKCVCLATLFCLVTGVEAVAHARLQTPAFDPLAGYENRGLRVDRQYLQNTLERLVVFGVGLFGLAAYSAGGDAMRAVLATTIVWIVARFAFWIGYHRSAALRAVGAPGMMVSLLVLLYVCANVSFEVAGLPGAVVCIIAFLAIEAVLFRTTRPPV